VTVQGNGSLMVAAPVGCGCPPGTESCVDGTAAIEWAFPAR